MGAGGRTRAEEHASPHDVRSSAPTRTLLASLNRFLHDNGAGVTDWVRLALPKAAQTIRPGPIQANQAARGQRPGGERSIEYEIIMETSLSASLTITSLYVRMNY